MNKTFVVAVASTMFLAGCGGTTVTPEPVNPVPTPVVEPVIVIPPISSEIDPAVKKVLIGVQTACKFQTTADFALRILSTFYADASVVTDSVGPAIKAICQAANSLKTASGRGRVAMVRGVPLEGHFVSQ